MQTENEFASDILKITMTIREKYPELSKYLEELRVTIPSEEIPEITCEDLKMYFDSLSDLFTKYKLTHPDPGP
jgi:hypothetical protein